MFQILFSLAALTPAADPVVVVDPCPPPMVCVKEAGIKKVSHTVYTTKCTDYCLPKRSLIKTLLCMGDDALECSKVRVKHQLVKKTHIEEKCEIKCVPKPAGACIPCGK